MTMTLWRGAKLLLPLKVRNIDELDFESLIEEIDLANRERKELESLDVLLAHLLKRLYILSSYDYREVGENTWEQRRHLQIY